MCGGHRCWSQRSFWRPCRWEPNYVTGCQDRGFSRSCLGSSQHHVLVLLWRSSAARATSPVVGSSTADQGSRTASTMTSTKAKPLKATVTSPTTRVIDG